MPFTFDAPRNLWVSVDWAITCAILLPLTRFLLQVADEAAARIQLEFF